MNPEFQHHEGPGATENESPNYFEFRDVCKGFDGRTILDHVSFSVKRGETCVIMGRSGVGKSVSLKHILGFLRPDSGQIFIDGQDVTDWTEDGISSGAQKSQHGLSVWRALRFADRRRKYSLSVGRRRPTSRRKKSTITSQNWPRHSRWTNFSIACPASFPLARAAP